MLKLHRSEHSIAERKQVLAAGIKKPAASVLPQGASATVASSFCRPLG
jgi:hypothetical protein